MVMCGLGYDWDAEAAQEGDRWMSALAIGLANQGMAADLRVREQRERPSGMSGHGKLYCGTFGLSSSTPVLVDQGGLQTFASEPEPMFMFTRV
jgi:hypothetical protein